MAPPLPKSTAGGWDVDLGYMDNVEIISGTFVTSSRPTTSAAIMRQLLEPFSI